MTAERSRISLVACVARKRDAQVQAAELYTSDWFVKARALVVATGFPWFILSAKYGLLAPDDLVAPYNVTLTAMRSPDRRAWADMVTSQMARRLPAADEVVVLAGVRYREGLLPWLRARYPIVRVPMEGLSIGRQLRWMKHAAPL